MTNLNKLKEINARGSSATRDPLKNDREPKVISAIGLNSDFSVGINKKSALLTSSDSKPISQHIVQGERLGTLQSNQRNLDQKRTELRGRLNELLDKLAVVGPTKGETRSVAPQMAREGDDNLSLNSFHSTAPQVTNLKSSTAGGFTSFYR